MKAKLILDFGFWIFLKSLQENYFKTKLVQGI